jgi:hypothetical protein
MRFGHNFVADRLVIGKCFLLLNPLHWGHTLHCLVYCAGQLHCAVSLSCVLYRTAALCGEPVLCTLQDSCIVRWACLVYSAGQPHCAVSLSCVLCRTAALCGQPVLCTLQDSCTVRWACLVYSAGQLHCAVSLSCVLCRTAALCGEPVLCTLQDSCTVRWAFYRSPSVRHIRDGFGSKMSPATYCADTVLWFSSVRQGRCSDNTSNSRPRPLPFVSVPIRYSLITPSFSAVCFLVYS